MKHVTNLLKYVYDAIRLRHLRNGFEFNSYDPEQRIVWDTCGVGKWIPPKNTRFTICEVREMMDEFVKNHKEFVNGCIGDFMPL